MNSADVFPIIIADIVEASIRQLVPSTRLYIKDSENVRFYEGCKIFVEGNQQQECFKGKQFPESSVMFIDPYIPVCILPSCILVFLLDKIYLCWKWFSQM